MTFSKHVRNQGGDDDNRSSASSKVHSSYMLQLKPLGNIAERYTTPEL